MALDGEYARSVFSILKIIELIMVFIGWACMMCYKDIVGQSNKLVMSVFGVQIRLTLLDEPTERRVDFLLATGVLASCFVIIWLFFKLCAVSYRMKNQNLIAWTAVFFHGVFFLLLLVSGALVCHAAMKLDGDDCDLISVNFKTTCGVLRNAGAFAVICSIVFFADFLIHIKTIVSGGTSSHGAAKQDSDRNRTSSGESLFRNHAQPKY